MGKLENRFPIYSRLLKLYPYPYQKRFNQETLQTLADMLDDPENSKAIVWTRAVIDLPLSLARQNLIYAGGIMKNETPQYIKRNTFIGLGLMAPFFLIVFSQALQNNQLSNNNVWASSLYITLVFMPLAAFMLILFTFLRWSRGRKRSLWQSLIDFRSSWNLIIVGGLALLITLFVPFHDSTHCVLGNPIREARNFSQTWQCIWQG